MGSAREPLGIQWDRQAWGSTVAARMVCPHCFTPFYSLLNECCPWCNGVFWGRRSKRKAAKASGRSKRMQTLVERDGAVCRGCGSKAALTIDHIRPLSKGGRDILSNIQILCHPCNQSKGNYLPIDRAWPKSLPTKIGWTPA